MIIAVSDPHLGYDKSDSEKFKEFIYSDLISNLSKNDHLVLLGDILEFWRIQNVDAITNNEEILSRILRLAKNTTVHYIIGNHDYTILNFYNNFKKNLPQDKYNFDVSKFLHLKDVDSKYFFMHGYQFEVISSLEPLTIDDYENISAVLCDRTNNLIGRTISSLWNLLQGFKFRDEFFENEDIFNEFKVRNEFFDKIDKITNPPEAREENMNNVEKAALSSSVREIFFGIPEDEFLIFGHTHRPFIRKDKRVANSGSWITYAQRYNTYIRIMEDDVQLIDY
jgi:UDP-2,3-diacylglucosamine pyrophosphatase LpxH